MSPHSSKLMNIQWQKRWIITNNKSTTGCQSQRICCQPECRTERAGAGHWCN